MSFTFRARKPRWRGGARRARKRGVSTALRLPRRNQESANSHSPFNPQRERPGEAAPSGARYSDGNGMRAKWSTGIWPAFRKEAAKMAALLCPCLATGVFASSALAEDKTVESRIGKLEFTHDFANGYPTKETVEKLYDERDF